MTHTILTGPDPHDLRTALEAAGDDVVSIDGIVSDNALKEADVTGAARLVLTDPTEATAIPLARDHVPDLTVAVYAAESVPPFASHLADLVIDPAAIDVEMFVEELLDR